MVCVLVVILYFRRKPLTCELTNDFLFPFEVTVCDVVPLIELGRRFYATVHPKFSVTLLVEE